MSPEYLSRRPTQRVLTIFLTTDDGTVLRCTPHEVGGVLAPRQWRWKLIESCGAEHIGPLYTEFTSQADLRRLISGWWDAKRELEQTGITTIITLAQSVVGVGAGPTVDPVVSPQRGAAALRRTDCPSRVISQEVGCPS
jgi:hypothetical protein